MCDFAGRNFIMRNFIAALAVLLTACATGPLSTKRDLEASSPQEGQIIACSGYKKWPDCYSTAKQTCANGFDVLAKEEILPTQTRTLRIRCQ
jgi:hypothetical protein